MGCTHSSADEGNLRVFRVMNVDERGQERNPGKIEITDNDLILYQRDKEPTRWPLRCLRRYGFDSELFSFESGRRCPTGPGIYLFRCQRAEALFNLLQECVAKAGQDDQQLARTADRSSNLPVGVSDVPLQNGNLAASATPQYNNHTEMYVNGDIGVEQRHSVSQLANNVPNDSQDIHEYVNTPVAQGSLSNGAAAVPEAVPATNGPRKPVKYAELDLPKREAVSPRGRLPSTQGDGAEAVLQVDTNSSQVMYINVGPGDSQQNSDVFLPDNAAPPRSLPLSPSSDQHSYANLHLVGNAGTSRPHNYKEKWGGRTINYIQVDIQSNENGNGASNVPASPISVCSSSNLDSPSRKTESYAKIDIDRTLALANSAKQSLHNEEEGCRKTRHNSNIDELA